MIPAAEMAAMIAEAALSLDATAQVQRATVSTSAFGHAVETWATVAGLAAMPVRIATPSTPQYQQIAARLGVLQVWLVSYPLTADVRGGDRLVIGADTLLVHSIESPQSYSTINQAVCAEVK